MKILAYKGKSFISKLIQLQTRSPYSHVGVQLRSGLVIEAWHVGGVQCNTLHSHLHTPGTEVDVFGIEYEFNEPLVEQGLFDEIGKGYDFLAVARFLSKRKMAENNLWFCSELVHAKLVDDDGPFLLKNIASSYISPRDVCISPYCVQEDTFFL